MPPRNHHILMWQVFGLKIIFNRWRLCEIKGSEVRSFDECLCIFYILRTGFMLINWTKHNCFNFFGFRELSDLGLLRRKLANVQPFKFVQKPTVITTNQKNGFQISVMSKTKLMALKWERLIWLVSFWKRKGQSCFQLIARPDKFWLIVSMSK